MDNAVVQQVNAEMEELQKQLSQFKSSVEYLNNAKSQVNKAVDAMGKAEDNFNQRVKELKDTYNSFIQLSDAVGAVIQKIDSVNFPERLNNIQATVKDTIKNLNEIKEATITEVKKAAHAITQADFDGRFSKLQSSIDISVKSNKELADGIHKMKIPEKIDVFEKSIKKHFTVGYEVMERNTKQITDDISNEIINLNIPIRIDKLNANTADILSALKNIHIILDSSEKSIVEQIKVSTEKQLSALSVIQEEILANNIKTRKTSQNSFIVTWIIILGFVVFYFITHKLRL